MKKIIGKENIQKILWSSIRENNSGKLISILSGKPVVYHFGDEFAEQFMQERKDKKIFLQSLRLTLENYDATHHKNYVGYLKDIRHIEYGEELGFDAVFIWNNKGLGFDIDNEKCYVFEGNQELEKYRNIFEEYWNK